MFYIKRTLTILFILAFFQVFSQELINKNPRTNKGRDINSLNLSSEGQASEQSEVIRDVNTLQQSGADLLTMKTEGEVIMTEENAVPVEFLAPSAEEKFKKGKMIQIRWTGGSPEDNYALDLFNGRYHYRHIAEVKNSGTYPWIISGDVEPGKEYKFKLTNTEDFGESAFSNTFIIKRKTPVVAWIVPGALVVGGGLFLIFFDNSPYELPDLPWPIDPN